MPPTYTDRTIKLTPCFIRALKELMRAECEMMRKDPAMLPECWRGGECIVGNLAEANPLTFNYGPRSQYRGFKVRVWHYQKERCAKS